MEGKGSESADNEQLKSRELGSARGKTQAAPEQGDRVSMREDSSSSSRAGSSGQHEGRLKQQLQSRELGSAQGKTRAAGLAAEGGWHESES